MASFKNVAFFISLFLLLFTTAFVKPQSPVLKYHNGSLLKGNITVNLVWYGKFTPIQRSILVDFLHSLGRSQTRGGTGAPSVSSWWQTTGRYRGGPKAVVVGNQILDERCSLGKLLTARKLIALAYKGGGGANKGTAHDAVNVVLTADDVTVEGFCSSRCGTHGSASGKKKKKEGNMGTYAWVGNSVSQCPGQCAWPFHQPIYGPQTPPLVPPSGDVGVDGMVINLATVLAGTVTNPFGKGYFQGPADAPLEGVSACAGIFGKGAYPGYPGEVLVDKTTGASYNAVGVNGRKFLLPAIWDPRTSTCKTPI